MAMIKTCKATVHRLKPVNPSRESVVNNGAVDRVRTASYRYATKPVVELDDRYQYDHVVGLHGDQQLKEGRFTGNLNGDFFWWRQTLLAQRKDGMHAFETWRGGDVLENHDENSIRGYITDVWPVFEDKSIRMLMATSKVFNNLIENIEKKKITDVSMGTIVGHSHCSNPKCHRHASKKNPNVTESDWCDCLKYHKGQYWPDAGCHIYEDNRDIFGVECSWITFGEGADPQAVLQKKVAALTNQQDRYKTVATRSIVELFDRRRQKRAD